MIMQNRPGRSCRLLPGSGPDHNGQSRVLAYSYPCLTRSLGPTWSSFPGRALQFMPWPRRVHTSAKWDLITSQAGLSARVVCMYQVSVYEKQFKFALCRRLEEPRPELDINLNPGKSESRGRVPGLGSRTTAPGRRRSAVESCVSQPLQFTRADPIKRGR